MTKKIWDKLAKDYDENVLSLTKMPRKMRQILNEVKKGLVLDIGTGSSPYLNKDLIRRGNKVIATDFSKKMLQVAAKRFTHSDLEYKLADSRDLPFKNALFDDVISVNSILPEKRKDIDPMVKEIHRVLKPSGKFIIFLPSFNAAVEAIKIYGAKTPIDKKNFRVFDTRQWQCFHTMESIKKMMKKAGFKKYKIKKSFLRAKDELNQIKKIYGVDTSKHPTYHYFLVAMK